MGIVVLYENETWLPPLVRELTRAGLPHELWFLDEGRFELDQAPPEAVYLNRMSPSAHTRGHAHSVSLAGELLAWLEGYGRQVVNGSRAFALEISKVRQYAALRRAGIAVPQTVAVAGGREQLRAAARSFEPPFITKHNRGGKGLGVQRFDSHAEFDAHLDGHLEGAALDAPADQIMLLQAYIQSPEPFITRVEMVGDRALYALRSDTRHGFELCPAEGCATEADPQSIFSLREGFDHPIVGRYLAFMRDNGIEIAGIEFVEDKLGNPITYDVNTTTNYSPAVEAAHGLNGMAAVVELLAAKLAALG